MGPRILLVNPSIHDFSAYDFWLKPYGLLQVAGQLRGKAELHLFDYLDLGHAFYLGFESSSYEWQRKTGGKVYSEELPRAVENLTAAGADLKDMTAYLIVGHPRG